MSFHFDPNRKFRITKEEIDLLQFTRRFLSPTEQTYQDYSQDVRLDFERHLQSIITPDDGVINGDQLRSVIFPTGWNQNKYNFDVFISHSHNDLDKAKRLARFLRNECGRTPFLDDDIWHSADGLLKKLDKEYCATTKEGTTFYNYQRRNFSTSHVHTMLSMAILEMIAQCRSFIFIESEESLDFNSLKEFGLQTQSPWIFQELQYAQMLSFSHDKAINEERRFSGGGQLRIRYRADLSNFTILTSRNIKSLFIRPLLG